MKNKLKLLIVLFIPLFILTGCKSTKKPINADTFVTKAKELYLYPNDVTKTYSGYAESAQSITGNGIYVLFIDGRRKYDIEGVFLDEVKNVYHEAGVFDDEETTTAMINTTIKNNNVEHNKTGGENWLKVSVTNKTNFYYVSWIEDTYIYIKSDIDKKTDMEKLIDAIGY